MKYWLKLLFGITGLLFVSCASNTKLQLPSCIEVVDSITIENKDYDIVTFGVFPQSKNSDGTYNTETIKWRVAQKKNGKALLICENVLNGNVPFYENYMDTRTVNSKIIYANNYEYSEVRAYLNGLAFQDLKKINTKWENKGFLQTAFTPEEQQLILFTNVDNSEKQMKLTEDSDSHKRYVCRNTRDKIFLLSMKEINDPELGFVNDSSRIRPATDYAYDNMAFRSGLAEKGGIWWLRSPVYNYASRAYLVLYTGEADNKTNRTRDPTTGIVPALWVPLKAIITVE